MWPHGPLRCRPAHALPRRPADVRLRLLGSHQLDNAAAAVAAAACLRRHGLERISLPAVAAGLEAATLPGRFQVRPSVPRVRACCAAVGARRAGAALRSSACGGMHEQQGLTRRHRCLHTPSARCASPRRTQKGASEDKEVSYHCACE